MLCTAKTDTFSTKLSSLLSICRCISICTNTKCTILICPCHNSSEFTSDLSIYCIDDSIIDIGCGKGRAIAYLLSHGYNCKITGIEINPEVAAVAREWTKPYPNVEIIEGDAFGLDYNDYNVLYMYRPMDTGAFICFVELLEETLTHDIKLYYYVDIQSGFYINGRNGWTLEKQEYIYRVDGHYIHKVPQRYSVWTYTAKNNR